MMRFEVLSIDDCPNGADAVRRLGDALAADGCEAPVEHRVIRTATDAAATAFAGSPTTVVDGEDLFSSAGRTDEFACWIYPTAAGFAGLPSTDPIRAAIAARGR